ncbi:MAG TPA: ester cyclase [Candidatus Dormibacteraeota bacterium]|jgi:predicted ester cyclase|nr:ester cyclase [Candidatus Dormibacteraeota bacterium]
MTTTNEALYRRIIEEGFNQGKLEVADELIAPGAVEHQRGSADGPEGLKKTIKILRSAFPDFTITITEIVAVGDKVWAMQKGGGTNDGGFFGHPPTGRKAFIDVIDVCRFEDGKLVEHWGVPDQLGMLMALGHVAPPARPAPVTV